MLLSHYRCSEYLLDNRAAASRPAELVKRLTSKHTRLDLISKLAAAEEICKARESTMWDEIVEFLGTRVGDETMVATE